MHIHLPTFSALRKKNFTFVAKSLKLLVRFSGIKTDTFKDSPIRIILIFVLDYRTVFYLTAIISLGIIV